MADAYLEEIDSLLILGITFTADTKGKKYIESIAND